MQGARQMASEPASILTRRDLASTASVATTRCSIWRLCNGSSWHRSSSLLIAAAASPPPCCPCSARCRLADTTCRRSLSQSGMMGSAKLRRNCLRRAARSSGSLPGAQHTSTQHTKRTAAVRTRASRRRASRTRASRRQPCRCKAHHPRLSRQSNHATTPAWRSQG